MDVRQGAAVRTLALHAAATLLVIAIGCGKAEGPRLIWEGTGAPRDARAPEWAQALATRQSGVRVGAWGSSPDATFQLVEARTPEKPHVHESHDLTVVLLRGRGILHVEGREHPMAAGDVVHIGRGRVHAFVTSGPEPTLGLAIFSPVLTAPDYREIQK
jgi:mannose-6-phosphate isomerase-like protein (cupin superfamily)